MPKHRKQKLQKFLTPLLLVVLVLQAWPLPVNAAPTINNFDVNPKVIDLGGASRKTETLELVLELSDVSPDTCSPDDTVVDILESDSSTFPRGPSIVSVRAELGRQTFSIQRDFDADTVRQFRASIYCQSFDLNFRDLAKSDIIVVAAEGATGATLINVANLSSSWASADTVIRIPTTATAVKLRINNAAIRIRDGRPREFLQVGDRLALEGQESNLESRGIVAGFQLGVDFFGKNPRDWGCERSISSGTNSCSIPIKESFSNPLTSLREISVPLSRFLSVQSENSVQKVNGTSFGLSVYPLLVMRVANVDFPFVGTGGQITITFDDTAPPEGVGDGRVLSSEGSVVDLNIPSDGIVGGIFGFLLSVVNIILGVIIGILRWVVWFIGWLIAVPLLESTLEMEVGEMAGNTIVAGWTFVRDVVNMLFILFLIAIGFGTILKMESYNYKKLLVNLIVMALLVNFSLLIARVILQITDAAQFNFLPVGELPGQPAGTTGVKYIFQNLSTVHVNSILDGLRTFTTDIQQAMTATFTLLFQFVLELGVIITFIAMALFMLIRTVAIWILLVLAPLAYVFFVLPATSGLAKKWWLTFIKYALFGPIFAFFLRLTLELYRNGLRIIPKQGGLWTDRDLVSQLKDLGRQGNFSMAQALDLLLIYVLVLAFLWAGLIISRQMGIFGANAIVGLAERGMKAPFALGAKGAWGLTKAGANFAAEKILQKYHKEIRPRKWLEGWKESREANRLAREEAGLAGAAGKSVLANPTSFFQRYWSPKGITKAITGRNKRGQRLLDQAAVNDKKADELEQQAKIFEDQGKMTEADEARRQAEALRGLASGQAEEAKHLVHDPDYFTQRKLREATNHEKAKVLGTTWQELFDLAQGAVEEKHIARFKALFEKLTETYNENELITHMKYTSDVQAKDSGVWDDLKERGLLIQRMIQQGMDADKARQGDFVLHKKGDFFAEDPNGIENFRRQILVGKLGMGEAESMRHLADIGDIAAERNHKGIWRLYNTKNARWRRNPFEDWDTEMRIEKGKEDAGIKLTRANRLYGHDEYTARNGTRISLTQRNEIEDTIGVLDNVKFTLGRGTFDLSKARALSFKPNIERLRKYAKEHLDNTEERKMLDLKNQQMDKNPFRPGQKTWTRMEEALWTIDQLEKYGQEQFKGDELEKWNGALEELLNENQISERHRSSIKEAGITNIRSAIV